MEKNFTVKEFKNYLIKQDSFNDAIYFLTEENIVKAQDCFNPEEWLKTNYNKEIGDIIETGSFNYMGRTITAILEADNKGHFTTNYPIVLSLSTKNDNERLDKVTIESIFGY